MLESVSRPPSQPLTTLLPAASPEVLDLIGRCLRFNVAKRALAHECLRHPYVAQYYDPNSQCSCNRVIQIPFLDRAKLKAEEIREVIYYEAFHKSNSSKGRS